MWLERPQWDLVYLLGRWGLLLGQACARTAFQRIGFLLKPAMTAGHKRVGLSPGWEPLAVCKVKKQNK